VAAGPLVNRFLRETVQVEIRPWGHDDLTFITELFESYVASERSRAPRLALPPDFSSKYIPKLTEDVRTKSGIMLVAEVDGERAGFIAVLPQESPRPWDESSGKSCLIWELHVDPRYRRQGIARRLLRTAESHFVAAGFDWISLGVFASNSTARRLYEAEGFRDSYSFMGKRLGEETRG